MTISRIAIGTIQPGADGTLAAWSLLAVLESNGYQVQGFHDRADAVPCEGIRRITGQSPRHLDSWLMTRDVCRELFVMGSQGADLAVVAGRYDIAAGSRGGGSLDTLCQWLDLPRVVIIDAELWQRGEVVTPAFQVAGIVLDRVADVEFSDEIVADVQRCYGAPVLGVLGLLPELRSALGRSPCGANPSEAILQPLGRELQATFRPAHFWNLLDQVEEVQWDASVPLPQLGEGRPLRIAVACDDAFQCYFPDTLDVLEACGAELRAFSPLRSPELPAGTDLVYFGCGQLVRHAEELAANCCIRQALQRFAAEGKRIYAEGAGVAYLSRQMVTGSGKRLPMANVLPAVAIWQRSAPPPEPAVIHFRRSTWLGDAYQELRGYLHSQWRIDAWGTNTNLAMEGEHLGDLIGFRNVIGSRLQLNFAAQPHLLPAFFHPRTPETNAVLATREGR